MGPIIIIDLFKLRSRSIRQRRHIHNPFRQPQGETISCICLRSPPLLTQRAFSAASKCACRGTLTLTDWYSARRPRIYLHWRMLDAHEHTVDVHANAHDNTIDVIGKSQSQNFTHDQRARVSPRFSCSAYICRIAWQVDSVISPITCALACSSKCLIGFEWAAQNLVLLHGARRHTACNLLVRQPAQYALPRFVCVNFSNILVSRMNTNSRPTCCCC